MRRPVQLVLVIGVVIVIAVGIGLLIASDGPAAYSVGGNAVSQPTVDGELEALAENQALAELVEQSGSQPFASTPNGAVTSDLAASWVGLRIAQAVAARDVARRGAEPTAIDRVVSHGFASQSLGGDDVFKTLPPELQSRLERRWLPIAIIERERADCPSGRYVAHLLVNTEAEAAAIKERVDAGADFTKLAREHSLDAGSAPLGGRLGCRDDLDDLIDPLKTAADALEVGAVSDPIQSEFGYHLLQVTDEFFAAAPSDVTLAAIQRHARRTPVEVDPRYGVWDRRNGQVLPPSTSADR